MEGDAIERRPGQVVIYLKTDGRAVSVWPVDAKERIRSGEAVYGLSALAYNAAIEPAPKPTTLRDLRDAAAAVSDSLEDADA